MESLIVNIIGEIKKDPLEQSKETLRIAQKVRNELSWLRKKCEGIKEIDDKPVSIIGLKLTGQTSVEKVGITYMQEGNKLNKEYPIDDFYNL